MVQKTFGIYADDLSGCRLFIEAGTQHIAAWFTDTLTGSMKAFEFFQFEEADGGRMDDTVDEVSQRSKLMGMQMDAASVVWYNHACTCIPEEFFNEQVSDAYLDTITGEADGTAVLWEHYNQYIMLSRYPAGYAALVKGRLAEGPFSHKFSALLKRYGTPGDAGQTVVRVIFYPSQLIIMAIKNGALQLIKCLPYSTADDALYAIMHIGAEFGIDLGSTKIIAAGLINNSSPLFDTLYRYLENFEIEQAAGNTLAANGFAEHPPHYFVHFMQ